MSIRKQSLILNYAMRHEGKITKKEAMNIDGVDTYYHNAEKYVGEILSNMVKRGLFKRIKPGHYEVDNTSRQKKIVEKNLPKLF